ncbi:hypothetical protein DIPPA_02315 [Diplonema papillatum]|nr:hypothetical protein DIPPA_02315 [Diplonema papillatum]|eukprot:gene17773-27370_t
MSELTLHIRNSFADTPVEALTVYSTDDNVDLYRRVGDLVGLQDGTFELIYDGNVMKMNTERICDGELVDDAEITVAESAAGRAKVLLRQMGVIEIGPKQLCEAASRGNLEEVKLLVEAGVDVNCTLPEE